MATKKAKKLINVWEGKGKIEIPGEEQEVQHKVEKIVGKTPNQKKYIQSIYKNDLTLVNGVAGTGKSFLAVAVGAYLLYQNQVERLVMVRPALEAGERLGYEPGTYEEKMAPYLRPLFDSLYKIAPSELINDWKKQRKIDIVPIAYMRGLTFENSFIIADEVSNCTMEQILLLITRFGKGSKMVMTGDIKQSDLPTYLQGSFELYRDHLKDISGVGVVELFSEDIQRHRLVGEILSVMKDKTLQDRLALRPRKLGEY